MADIFSDLARQAGIDTEKAKQGLGAVLGFLKAHLPAEVFSRIEAAVPKAQAAMDAGEEVAQEAADESKGLLSNITEMAGKLFGKGAGSELLAKLSAAGFSIEQIQNFIPTVMNFLRDKLPADLWNKIKEIVPTPEPAEVAD